MTHLYVVSSEQMYKWKGDYLELRVAGLFETILK